MGQCCATTSKEGGSEKMWPAETTRHKSIAASAPTAQRSRELRPAAPSPGFDALPEEEHGEISEEQRTLEDAVRAQAQAHTNSPSSATQNDGVGMTMTDYPDFVGLPNRSCDCFWNATLQCLRHTPQMQRVILESSVPPPGVTPATNLLHAYANLLLCMDKYAGNGRAVPVKATQRAQFVEQATDEIKSGNGVRLIEVKGSAQDQHDAHEFFLLFLDKLAELKIRNKNGEETVALQRTNTSAVQKGTQEEELAIAKALTEANTKQDHAQLYRKFAEFACLRWKSNQSSPRRTHLGALMQGQHIVAKLCTKCGLCEAVSADPFVAEEVHLSEDDPNPSLHDLLTAKCRLQQLPDYKCDKCKEVGTTRRRECLFRLPQIYVVHLNRVAHDRVRHEERRVGSSVDFPDEIDIADQLLYPSSPRDYSLQPCSSRYRLYAATFHKGSSVRHGHYFAYVHGGSTQYMVTSNSLELHESEAPGSKPVHMLKYGTVIECLECVRNPENSDILVKCSHSGGEQEGWLHQFDGIKPVEWVKLNDEEVIEIDHPRVPEQEDRGHRYMSPSTSRAVMLYYSRLPLPAPASASSASGRKLNGDNRGRTANAQRDIELISDFANPLEGDVEERVEEVSVRFLNSMEDDDVQIFWMGRQQGDVFTPPVAGRPKFMAPALEPGKQQAIRSMSTDVYQIRRARYALATGESWPECRVNHSTRQWYEVECSWNGPPQLKVLTQKPLWAPES